MKKVLILGANGQIARIVENRLLNEDPDVELTLFLRNASRLSNLKDNPRVTVIDGDVEDAKAVSEAISFMFQWLIMIVIMVLLKTQLLQPKLMA